MIILHSDTAGRVPTTVGRPPLRAPAESAKSTIRRLLRRIVIRMQLDRGPFLAAFDAGLYDDRLRAQPYRGEDHMIAENGSAAR